MTGPMAGVRVVEAGYHVAGPSAAGLLGDWGAHVVKVEPPSGDPMRTSRVAAGLDINPQFELDNRNKRSLCVDLTTDDGRETMSRLLEQADVFVSNLRSSALTRLSLDCETLTTRYPGLVYAQITGYGLSGPEADRPAFDIGPFWARTGIAAALTPEGETLPMQRGGMGDHMAGLAAAAGIVSALFARQRTGRGDYVSTSLMRVGAYMLGCDLSMNLRTGSPTIPWDRRTFTNPLINSYRDRDGKWFWLLCNQSDRHWPDVLRAIGRQDLQHDQRFETADSRRAHAEELIDLLDNAFAELPISEWAPIFDREQVWWSVVQASHELIDDPQAIAGGLFVDVPSPSGSVRSVASPVDFATASWAPSHPSPRLGEHSAEILSELGYAHEEIASLVARSIIIQGTS